jgi:hypothetical protein
VAGAVLSLPMKIFRQKYVHTYSIRLINASMATGRYFSRKSTNVGRRKESFGTNVIYDFENIFAQKVAN